LYYFPQAKAESQLKASAPNAGLSEKEENQRNFHLIVESILKEFRARLKEMKYYGHYFDRKSEFQEKLCDVEGQFTCEGRFDADVCSYNCENEESKEIAPLLHVINPYESQEARYIFKRDKLLQQIVV